MRHISLENLSLKIKLTLLYTFFMLLVTCAALAILFSLSNREILSLTQAKLESRVQESTDDLDLHRGKIEIDSDFYSVTRDVYLSLYDENMYFMYGKVPYGFNEQPEISDGETQRIRGGGKDWYVYDMSFRLSEDYTVYVRGVTSVTDAEESFSITLRFALILFPLMILAMAFIGYRFTRRTLLPVKTITRTVQEIRADADLSKRIGLPHSGTVERGTAGNRNVDEIHYLADTFDEMLEELEEVFKREKQFTSDVSHELRTPVSVILAQCGACLSDESLTDRQREQIMLIQRKAEDMAEMISHLLFLSRADQGRQPLNRERLNVSELTQMVVEEQEILAEDAGREIKIKSQIGPDIYADVDESFYIRLLVNLISNAVTYSEEGGTVEVSLRQEEQEIVGTVRDNGIGISETDLPHIWERFYRGDTSRSGSGNSGLGLSMVKWIVEAHNGWIKAESTLGEGSMFTFGLPLEAETAEKEEREREL